MFNILRRFFFADAEILTQSKGTDAVDNAEIYSLGIASLQIRDLFERSMEYLGCCDPVNILFLSVGIDQLLISGHMGQYTQFDLRIIRIHEFISPPGDKYLADLSAQFHTHGNVLQIRFCGTDPPCGCNGLIEVRMNSSIRLDKSCQPVRIG